MASYCSVGGILSAEFGKILIEMRLALLHLGREHARCPMAGIALRQLVRQPQLARLSVQRCQRRCQQQGGAKRARKSR
jgi:hypothetical protein